MSDAELVAGIEDAAREGSWNAAAWLLERRSPEQWSKRQPRPKPEAAPPPEEDPIAEVIDLAKRRRE